jgi:hypothetical protein
MEARYPGDPRVRPARAFCAVSATGSIRRRRDELIDKAVVCSFDGNNHEVDILVAGDMLREKFSLHHDQYQLVKHFPEQFFIVFLDPRSKQWALDRRSVSYRGRIFHFGDWSEDSYARKTNLEFRVKVWVEGIPVHYWGEDVSSKALGKSCAIHYVQERTRRRECTRSFDLWAWCSGPCDIPKEVLLTVLEPDRELPPVNTPLALVGAQHIVPADLKAGHVYTLRNHIEVVEDLSFLSGRGSRGDRLIASSAGSLSGAMAPRTQWAKKESVLKLLEEERLCDRTGVMMMMMMMMMGIFSEADAAATTVIVVCLIGRAPRVVEGAWTTAIVPTASLGIQPPSVGLWGGGVDAVILLGAQGEGQVCLFRRPHCYRCLAAGGMSRAS